MENKDIYKAFQQLPKGADLHSHFSSIVDYEDILEELQNSSIINYVYYNKKNSEIQMINDYNVIRNNQQQYVPLLNNQKNIKQLISGSVQYAMKKPTRDGNEPNEEDKAFQEYNALGNIFYTIIKGEYFYKNYIDLIYKNMKRHSIYYQEIRLKIDLKERQHICTPDQILEYIKTQNKELKQYQVKIIAQFGRWGKDLKDQVQKVLDFLKKKKIFQKTVIGIDFTGQEVNDLNKELMEDKEILEQMKELNLQFYNHAGEIIIPENQIESFEWEKNHNFNNVIYLLENHQQNNKDLYKKKIRIGHGIVFLQYLHYLKNDEKQKETYEKYLKLSENVCFEVCPFSNLHFYNGQLKKEIYEEFSDRICICTDDQNKIDKSLSDAFYYLFSDLNIEFKYLIKYVENSIKYSSMDEEQKSIVRKQVQEKMESYKEENQNISQNNFKHFEIKQSQSQPWWQIENFNQKKIKRY